MESSASSPQQQLDPAAVSRDTILYDVWIHQDATISVQITFSGSGWVNSSLMRFWVSFLQQEQLAPPPVPLELHQGGAWKALGSGTNQIYPLIILSHLQTTAQSKTDFQLFRT
jgi:hypothetical protein